MSTTEIYRYQQAIENVKETIPNQLKGFDEENEPYGSRDNASQYADSISSLVFDAIENSIFWTDKVKNLDVFRDKLLDIAIEVWKRSEENGIESSRQIMRQHQ